ncbi:MAG: OmpA family protein [Magnetococcales bacterium]|nr:OmpA family protein [Magnetococcales bacterium]MBF0149525.1 OmpA family protein [Magnetococcales bacterium]MBF0174400.1 OmpA family protein [Magnetococcales bacterium]MBF0348054.1 OmpA family protein [Magnetococcales bacterium]MBF0630813.1 OmpA family protein [Magnetococcales bacterium]
MSKCPPCKKGAPAWLNTFADMMSLLLTFFILLLSFAQLDVVKFEEASGSIRDAFGVQRIQQINPLPTGEDLIATEFDQEIIIVQLLEKIEHVLVNQIDNGEAEVIELEQGFLVRLAGDTLFQPSSLKLRDPIKPTLQQVATLLAGVKNEIFVNGHTDNAPPPSDLPFASNWGYSAAMSAAIVQFLAENGGVDPVRLQARGLGQYSPRQTNDTDAGRAANRRIEIMVSRTTHPAVIEKFIQPPRDLSSGSGGQPERGNRATSESQGGTP